MESILEKVNYPEDLKKLNLIEKKQLAEEIRKYILEVVSENEYYEAKGTFRIKKDGSVTLLLSKLCRVVDGLTKDFFDLSEYKWITNLPDKFTYDNYSVDGEVLRLGGNTFVKCTEDIDWRIK